MLVDKFLLKQLQEYLDICKFLDYIIPVFYSFVWPFSQARNRPFYRERICYYKKL
jgi:hypothetical protein